MTGYSIAEEFVLPSRGKIYSENVNPNVKLRSMTTEEEIKRLAPSEREYKKICEIIDDCLVENPGISSYDMCLADYQFLLHKLRVVTYGSKYRLDFTCPFCRSTDSVDFNLDDLEVIPYDSQDFATYTNFTLPRTQKRIQIKMQTPRMIDDANMMNADLKRRSKGASQDSVFLYTVQNMIETVDGEVLDPVKKEDFVRSLPMMDTNYIIQNAQKLVESFGINTKLQRVCPTCGLEYDASFRVTGEFFGPTIDLRW